jgi:hypothetical protein
LQAWQAALSTWLAFLAAVLPPAVHTDTATSAVLASVLDPAVMTDTATSAFLAAVLLPAVHTDTGTSAVLALVLAPAVLTNSATSAGLAFPPSPAVMTNLATTAFFALVSPASVLARTATAHGYSSSSTVAARRILLRLRLRSVHNLPAGKRSRCTHRERVRSDLGHYNVLVLCARAHDHNLERLSVNCGRRDDVALLRIANGHERHCFGDLRLRKLVKGVVGKRSQVLSVYGRLHNRR